MDLYQSRGVDLLVEASKGVSPLLLSMAWFLLMFYGYGNRCFTH